jgi:ATP-binding cassette subfamily F protein 3
MAITAIKSFSGGEKARLVLALLVYQRPNLLLLDEPTNHLDLEMRLALTTALQEFTGAIILVSHDRHLIRTVADQLYLITDQKISEFDGDLDDYRQWVKEQQKRVDVDQNELSLEASGTTKKQQRQIAAARREQLKPLKNKSRKLEQTIEKLEQEKSKLEQQLADSQLYHDDNKSELQVIIKKQGQVQQQLADAEEQWLAIHEQLEELALDNNE